MEKPWYEGTKSDEDRLYEESVKKIKSAVNQSLTFEQAIKLIEIENEALKNAIIDDALKVLIAEIHFSGGKTLKELANKLRLPLKRLTTAKKEMLQDVEAAAIEKYKESINKTGEA